jgi:cytochrome c-type biogenesis protein CcmH
MTLWIILIALSFMALGFVVWPLYRSSGRLSPLLATVIVLTVGLSAALYHRIGQPGVSSGPGSMPDVGEMVPSLAKRLEENPDDADGWLMLGRSYQSLEQYDDAVAAFEKAMALEQGKNAQTLVALAIVLLERQGGQMTDRAASLFENALVLEPNNPNALFYGGGAAARRGNTALAADRWEILLGLNAPPEIRELLESRIREWRGLPPDVGGAAGTLVSIQLSVSEEAISALPADATVYVIARDPAQPSPPIAVTPRRLSELPATVALSDSDAMVPGRLLSGFSEVEVVARVSVSGNPMAQSGDWSGSLVVKLAGDPTVNLVIDQKVP